VLELLVAAFFVFFFLVVIMFVVVSLVFGKERNFSANVFAIHGITAAIEDKIRPEDDEHAIAGL